MPAMEAVRLLIRRQGTGYRADDPLNGYSTFQKDGKDAWWPTFDDALAELQQRFGGAPVLPVPMMSGIPVTRRAPLPPSAHFPKESPGVIFVPLPRAMWVPIQGGCCCKYCSKDERKSAPAYWDTLAISAKEVDGRNDTTWTVHHPELHQHGDIY